MAYSVGVEESGQQQRQRRGLNDEPSPAASLETGAERDYFVALGDDDDSGPGSDSVEPISEVMSPVCDPKYDAVSKQRPSDCVRECPCRRWAPTGRHAAELFPLPVSSSSSLRVAVAFQTRASSVIGVGRLLLLLPWLLTMTSFCLAAALPVDSDASRAPVRVFDGSSNNADVDGPVSNEYIRLLSMQQ